MPDTFRPVFDAMKKTVAAFTEANYAIAEAHDILSEASRANGRAGEGLQAMIDTVLHAQEEHADLRETVDRHEALILTQGQQINAQEQEIRAMRDRLDRGDS